MLLYNALSIPDDARTSYSGVEQITKTKKFMGGTVGKIYYENLLDYDVFSHIGGYTKDVLIFHGDSDKVVNLSYSQKATKIYSSAKLKVFKGEGHGFKGHTKK